QNNATFGDQATVGSLTFNVITLTLKPSSESSRHVASGDVGASGKTCTSDQGSLGEGIQSNGLLKLTQTHPDLAGVGMLEKSMGKEGTS
ncbi:hypothetical protein QQP08_000776, partial [Theobroma cacao]